MTVTDSSPLIGLERIGRLDLMPAVLGEVAAPSAVVREFGRRPEWLEEREVQSTALVRALRSRLDEGEAEAIALATETGARAVLLDERRARRVAEEVGVPVLGLVGLLLRAKRDGLTGEIRPLLDALDAASFRVSAALRAEALRRAGEPGP